MIKFEKNVEKLLPYDREQYVVFLDDEFDSEIPWYGVSFQLSKSKEINLEKAIEMFKSVLIKIVSKLDDNSFWIINHDDKDLKWFPNEDDNLILLKALLKDNNIQNDYKGSITIMKSDLIFYANELISYPYLLSYKNLDISHSQIQFVIKTTSHLTLDLLSTDKILLRKIIEENSSSQFILKEYRESSFIRRFK